MKNLNRGTLITGIVLLAIGIILMLLNLIPGVGMSQYWPLIIILIGLGFFLPVLFLPESRHGLAGLFIPGMIFLFMGLLFLYDTLSGDWTVWAFGWLLIPASVGFGIYLGALIGIWGKGSTQTGLWIGVTSLALFSILAAIFGRPFIKYTGSIILIASGVLFVLNSVRKPKELS